MTLVKLADVIPESPKQIGPPAPAPEGMTVEPKDEPKDGPNDTIIWSYKKVQSMSEPIPKPNPEEDHTPGFDFSEKVTVEGKERKVELAASGLYVFDKGEKFERPTPTPTETETEPVVPISTIIGVRRVPERRIESLPRARTVNGRGLTIKSILNLTKKTK
jgi:hypothetical protein